ncbi:MAG: hypothetical protein FWF91_08095, partial [Coriobacteriia bacterium]|nr:hypothetical protein [Coriobacteriia bacterium]
KTAHVSARLPRCAAFGGSARNDGGVCSPTSCCVLCTSYQYGASEAGDKRRPRSGRSGTIRNDGEAEGTASGCVSCVWAGAFP